MSVRNPRKRVSERMKKEIANFYKEEFVRHQARLETQKTFYPEETYVEIEGVLRKIIDEIDKMSAADNFEELAQRLLERIDVVTSLSRSKLDPSYRVH